MPLRSFVLLLAASFLIPSFCRPAMAEEPAPKLTKAQFGLIDASHFASNRGDLDEAARLLEEAMALGEHHSIHRYLGAIRLSQKRCVAARDHLIKAEYHEPWAMPGKDGAERHRRELLARVHSTCPARLRLDCGGEVQVKLNDEPIECGKEAVVGPGMYVLYADSAFGGRVLPRRIVAQGAELITLRLEKPNANQTMAHWVPTSPQLIPEQDPAAEYRDSVFTMGVVMGISGALITGLSVTLLVLTYQGGDPEDNPDPSLTEEEQFDEELLYIQGLSYGWAFSVGGAVLMGVGLAFLFDDDEPSNDTPGFSLGGGVEFHPMLGEVWGGGLSVDF